MLCKYDNNAMLRHERVCIGKYITPTQPISVRDIYIEYFLITLSYTRNNGTQQLKLKKRLKVDNIVNENISTNR